MMMIPFYEHQTELMRGFSQHQLDFPPHLHNCPELVRMRAGQLKVQINTQEHIVDPESLVIIFPNVIHSTVSDDCQIIFHTKNLLIILNSC